MRIPDPDPGELWTDINTQLDHVPPPTAISPEKPISGQDFGFDRYGVLVPSIIVSPYVPTGTIFGKTSGAPYDHTSIIATLRKRFTIRAGPASVFGPVDNPP